MYKLFAEFNLNYVQNVLKFWNLSSKRFALEKKTPVDRQPNLQQRNYFDLRFFSTKMYIRNNETFSQRWFRVIISIIQRKRL